MQTTKLIFLAVPILLSGCVAAPVVLQIFGVGSLAVSETTGKSITDHTVSAVNGGKDCRVVRIFRDQAVCQDEYATKLTIITTGVKTSTIQEIEPKYK